MTLSIIIVNYNVKYFLEQCLCSVRKAIGKIDAEVFIVDNCSGDGSIDYLSPGFPGFRFIANQENDGFGKASNKALSRAKGKYILFLNPDTIVAEDSFEKCISFLESHPKAGALGVKMIDGSGVFLRESKRGFPAPWPAFCKLTGLTAMFPHSRIFAGYYLGNLSENQNQAVDVISGAFFFARKKALDKTGGFDEQFFMYAEDIDLSYRLQQSGWVNHYLAETAIIHFKGESTQRGFYYLKMFYKAMDQFVKKHGRRSFLYSVLIASAIRLRAVISLLGRIFSKPATRKISMARYFLTGDARTVNQLQNELRAQKKLVVDDKRNAGEIIFCEGKDFSFKQIIEALANNHSGTKCKIHAANSHSIVGSRFKNRSGEIIVFA